MPTTNKIFLDSSFLIEGYKGKHQQFYFDVIRNPALQCCINSIVCSEYWYNLLGLISATSPLSLKEKKGIPAAMDQDPERFLFFERYSVLNTDAEAVRHAHRAMHAYNLLSNDALILGTCLTNQVTGLASHDTDFETACLGEGIHLITPENYQQQLLKL